MENLFREMKKRYSCEDGKPCFREMKKRHSCTTTTSTTSTTSTTVLLMRRVDWCVALNGFRGAMFFHINHDIRDCAKASASKQCGK